MYNSSEIDDNTIMKELKMAEKSLKKGLTKNVWRCILTELSARGTQQAADRMILENDTESRRTRSRDFHESRRNKDSQFVKWVLSLKLDFKVQYRIKHESLILAQDERWRRA